MYIVKEGSTLIGRFTRYNDAVSFAKAVGKRSSKKVTVSTTGTPSLNGKAPARKTWKVNPSKPYYIAIDKRTGEIYFGDYVRSVVTQEVDDLVYSSTYNGPRLYKKNILVVKLPDDKQSTADAYVRFLRADKFRTNPSVRTRAKKVIRRVRRTGTQIVRRAKRSNSDHLWSDTKRMLGAMTGNPSNMPVKGETWKLIVTTPYAKKGEYVTIYRVRHNKVNPSVAFTTKGGQTYNGPVSVFLTKFEYVR